MFPGLQKINTLKVTHAMKRLISSVAALGWLCASPLLAQDNPVVVELFTSQGCSSCPPADAMMAELAKRDDVIALALHVDYWDYIGWKDEFGDPAHADRQRAYAAAAGRKSIYTPEMIIDGQTDVIGAKPMILSRAIAQHKAQAPKVDLGITRTSGAVRITAATIGAASGPFTLHLIRYTPKATTQIKRGENAGHTFDYHNIVSDWTVVGVWDGAAPYDASVPVAGELPVVVLVQHSDAGPIAAAARIR